MLEQTDRIERKRRFTRFKPEPDEGALISSPHAPKNILAVVIDESSKGAGLVLDATHSLKAGEEYEVKLGKLAPRRFKLVWSSTLSLSALRIGIEYLD